MKIDAVIKIGGSVIENKHVLKELCKNIVSLIKQNFKIIIIPGGWKIADEIRKVYKQYGISNAAAHWMAIMGMNINGILISSLNKKLIPVDNITECMKALKNRLIPVLLPYRILKKYNELPKSWDVTSDSISLYFTHLLNARCNVLLKNIAGIYHPTKKKLIKRISTCMLRKWRNRTCVDNYLPFLLSKYKINSYVISGYYPKKIKNILDGKDVHGTVIIP